MFTKSSDYLGCFGDSFVGRMRLKYPCPKLSNFRSLPSLVHKCSRHTRYFVPFLQWNGYHTCLPGVENIWAAPVAVHIGGFAFYKPCTKLSKFPSFPSLCIIVNGTPHVWTFLGSELMTIYLFTKGSDYLGCFGACFMGRIGPWYPCRKLSKFRSLPILLHQY